ncbi:MAG: aminotransferase class I/II-fold pyridoxal phosphate-dependent enzyme [Chitinophagaceae bacterium]|nr:aminotransferase class I/II-fold pyridoxal phosphate-dependent enzyme [Chitinophagaceae bacterium]
MLKGKIPGKETIFTTMSQLAREHQAINLGQGFPDYDPDQTLINLVNEAMNNGYNQYAPAMGYLPLRESIAQKSKSLYHCEIDPQQEVCITPGGTYAIYTALTTVLHPGDEVIVFEPAYDSYVPDILINGAKPVFIPLSYPDFSIDWDRVRNAISGKTKMIMINSPHNPTSSVLNSSDLKELSEIVNRHDLYVLSDEVYEPIIFDGMKHESVLKYPEIFKKSFVVFSFGKVYHCTGWKTGYCIAPKSLMKEFAAIHQFNAFCCFHLVQVALATFMKNEKTFSSLSNFYQKKRDLLSSQLTGAGFKALPSHGSFFQLFDYSSLSDEDDLSFAKNMTIHAGVGAIPVSPFYSQKSNVHALRFCFAKKDETLVAAGERLKNYFRN